MGASAPPLQQFPSEQTLGGLKRGGAAPASLSSHKLRAGRLASGAPLSLFEASLMPAASHPRGRQALYEARR